MKKSLKPQTLLGPIPAVMVSCGNMETANIITIAWTGIINSEPPLIYVSIRPNRHSYTVIKETGKFIINVPNEKLVWETDYCGTKSGKNVDKFKETKLTKEESEVLEIPQIRECPINIECIVREIKHLGSHDMFISEIVGINAEEEYIKEDGKIDLAKVKALTYLGSEYYIADKKIADRGICLKEQK